MTMTEAKWFSFFFLFSLFLWEVLLKDI